MKTLIVGCSYANGHGLNLEIDDPILWANQLIEHIAPGSQIFNLSCSGKNNHWIFTEACTALTRDEYDTVLVAWTNQSRLNFEIGLETYTTSTMLNDTNVNINPGITVSGKHLLSIGNELRKLQNDHWTLLDLVKYVNILYDAQVKQRGKTLLCVNSLLHIPKNYFVEQQFTLPGELSDFHQMMFSADTRDDQEVKELYNLTHQSYRYYGGIRSEVWLNLYQSLHSMKVDWASDIDPHPGKVSQNSFAKYLIDQYNETSNNTNT
jgi:hypothetical protein